MRRQWKERDYETRGLRWDCMRAIMKEKERRANRQKNERLD